MNAFERCLYNQFVGSVIPPLLTATRVAKEKLPHLLVVRLSVLILGGLVLLCYGQHFYVERLFLFSCHKRRVSNNEELETFKLVAQVALA